MTCPLSTVKCVLNYSYLKQIGDLISSESCTIHTYTHTSITLLSVSEFNPLAIANETPVQVERMMRRNYNRSVAFVSGVRALAVAGYNFNLVHLNQFLNVPEFYFFQDEGPYVVTESIGP